MEYYAALYYGDEKQKYSDQVEIGPKESESIDGKKGWLIKMNNTPNVFIAYSCWAWDYYGRTFTNLLFQINPHYMWRARPTYGGPPHIIDQVEFFIQAFQKRMINKNIRYQKHPLFKVLNTCEAQKDQQATRGEFIKLLDMMRKFISNDADSPSAPTPPKPDEFDYNNFIVYTRQCEILKELDPTRY